jgi:uncharacterized protein YbjT (DUF2867 family)
MVGGGCRGLALARELVAEGNAVRAVTRSEARRRELEEAGCQCWIGDPDRVGTLRYALDNVTVLLWLLGTVAAPELHGSRLAMMLDKTTDTTVRGVVYEVGSPAGIGEVERAHELNEIPYALLREEPRDLEVWLPAARAAIDSLLAARR